MLTYNDEEWLGNDTEKWREQFGSTYAEWWQYACDSCWASDTEILNTCGAMYLMYLNQQWNEGK